MGARVEAPHLPPVEPQRVSAGVERSYLHPGRTAARWQLELEDDLAPGPDETVVPARPVRVQAQAAGRAARDDSRAAPSERGVCLLVELQRLRGDGPRAWHVPAAVVAPQEVARAGGRGRTQQQSAVRQHHPPE
eukprot:scaffold5478_cov63-Phaeocystis_antarctica.AAC.13